jgi:hypothetical protein
MIAAQRCALVSQFVATKGRGKSIAKFIISCFNETMDFTGEAVGGDELLQVQVPSVTKRGLGHRAVDTREPIRMIVLRALDAYGIPVPADAITDRRRRTR